MTSVCADEVVGRVLGAFPGTLQVVATVTVVAGYEDGLAEPALLSAWLTLGDFLGASLGNAGAAGASLALASRGRRKGST